MDFGSVFETYGTPQQLPHTHNEAMQISPQMMPVTAQLSRMASHQQEEDDEEDDMDGFLDAVLQDIEIDDSSSVPNNPHNTAQQSSQISQQSLQQSSQTVSAPVSAPVSMSEAVSETDVKVEETPEIDMDVPPSLVLGEEESAEDMDEIRSEMKELHQLSLSNQEQLSLEPDSSPQLSNQGGIPAINPSVSAPPPNDPSMNPPNLNPKALSEEPKWNNVVTRDTNMSVWDPTYVKSLEQIRDALQEMDEDNNGELDIEEFIESMAYLDKKIRKRDTESMYNQCTFTSNQELRIHSFIEILREKAQPNNKDTPTLVLRRAFPDIFAQSTLLSPTETTDASEGQLKYIKEVMTGCDEDSDGKLDFPEFESAMDDLGLDLDRKKLQFVFAHLVVHQSLYFQRSATGVTTAATDATDATDNNDDNDTVDVQLQSMAEADSIPSVDSPARSHCIQDSNASSVASAASSSTTQDDNSNIDESEIQSKTNEKRRELQLSLRENSSNVTAELSVEFLMSQFNRFVTQTGPSLGAHQIISTTFGPILEDPNAPRTKKKAAKKRGNTKLMRSGSVRRHGPIHSSLGLTRANKSKSFSTVSPMRRYFSVGDTDEKDGSVLQRKGATVECMQALRGTFRDVDESKTGKLDFEEFFEVLSTLQSTITRMDASSLFFALASRKSRELDYETFLHIVKNTWESYDNHSCDQIFEIILQKSRPRLIADRGSSLSSLISGGVGSPRMGAMKNARHQSSSYVIQIVQKAVEDVDSSDIGTVDLEEFTDFLSNWDLDRKLSALEIKLIFNHLIDDDISDCDASMDLFMTALCHVAADHPNYDAKRAVFRVCRRILKNVRGRG